MKRHRGGGFDPFEHNRIVARRKKYRAIAKTLRAAGRKSDNAPWTLLALAAERAAESLRNRCRPSTDSGQQ
jgi:hypothetical protein